jgi:uncharacterized protein (DUF1015 family)
MADVRPFRGLRYTSAVDPALAIAPPYDVISPADQRALYERSPYNVVRIEYGQERAEDSERDNRYTRAAHDLARWRAEGVLAPDAEPAIYAYRQEFSHGGRSYARHAWFVALRLEEWEKGVVKPHEHTLARPKEDRLNLLRATRAQISPVYGLLRPKQRAAPLEHGTLLVDFEVGGQRHTLEAIGDHRAVEALRELVATSDVYVADGHHRYETALAYRDEVRGRAAAWTGEEPENFVLMALSRYDDPGLLVLPTHRLVHQQAPADAIERLARFFDVAPFADDTIDRALAALAAAREPSFLAIGLLPDALHLLTLRSGLAVESLMREDEPEAWKRLDVNVLHYGVLQQIFGIDEAALTAGGAVTYTQDAGEAQRCVASGEASCAFLLKPTPVGHVFAVADAGARMPQKSTYFHPKLPTGLVMRALD